MLGVIEVRVEASPAGLGAIGCTSLLRAADRTMVDFALRDWPADDSSHDVCWELLDPESGESWPRRDGGSGDGPLAHERGGHDGRAWFETAGTPHVRLRASLAATTLLDTEVELRELAATTLDITVLDARSEPPKDWRSLIEPLRAFRYGPAIADVVGAVSSPVSRVAQLVIAPVSLEWWGEISRLTVHVAGDVDPAEVPSWWQLGICGGPPQWALTDGFGSAPGGAVGHLLYTDPVPPRSTLTTSRWRSLLRRSPPR